MSDGGKGSRQRPPSAGVVKAMRLVRSGMTPYQAARKAGIALSTMYRSPLYKDWRDAREQRTGK